jgi:hypothetical protein
VEKIAVILSLCLFLSGCGSTPRERLIAKCSQYENTGTIPAEVNNVDRALNALAGLFEGALAGLGMGWVTLAVEPSWRIPANTVFISASLAGAVIGWNIADPGQSLKKGEFSEDEVRKICAGLLVSEKRRAEALKYRDRLPSETGPGNFLWSLAGFGAGAAVGYFTGALAGYSINNSGGGNALTSPAGLTGGLILGVIAGAGGAIYGWNAPQRFMGDDEIAEKVLKGNYIKEAAPVPQGKGK